MLQPGTGTIHCYGDFGDIRLTVLDESFPVLAPRQKLPGLVHLIASDFTKPLPVVVRIFGNRQNDILIIQDEIHPIFKRYLVVPYQPCPMYGQPFPAFRLQGFAVGESQQCLGGIRSLTG